MPQACRICKHSDRQAIDAVLVEGWPPLRVVGAQYGVSKDSLSRHYHAHIPDDEPTATSGEDSEHEKSAEIRADKKSDSILNNQKKSNGGTEARRSSQDEAGSVLKQRKTIAPEDAEARYSAFIEQWRGNLGFALYDMADWPERGEDLQALISEGIERGDLFYYAGLKWYCKTAQCIGRMNRDE